MGEVYLAEDQKLRRQVALKFLPEELTRNQDRRQRFIQEARAAAAIQHAHIGAVHDVDEYEGRTFIVMEYVRGQSLREIVGEGALTVRRSLDLGIQIADGLARAHERGVVHRDLKPENVIVSEDGYAKIIDFGLAKLLEPPAKSRSGESEGDTETLLRTREGLIVGTVAYMSPEQARGDVVDARSDIFSFGIVLYEMLSGRPPFQRGSVAEILSAVLNEEPPPPTIADGSSSPDLQRILRKALKKDANERYQSIRELALDLRQAREDMASGERRPAPTVPRRRAGWYAVAVGFLAVATAVAWYLGSRPSSAPPGIGTTGRPAIAVMSFEDHTGAEEIRWLARGLPEMLVTGLAQTPGLDIISSQRIHEVIVELGQESLDAVDRSVIADVARRAGAGAVVVGSIFKSASEIRLDVQVQEVSSGRVLSAESVRGSDVFPLVDELTGRIRASLELTDRPAGRPIAEVTTGSLEAYEAYAVGLDARRNVRYTDAREHLERAVAIDSSFALAYVELSRVTRLMGLSELADSHRSKVLELMNRLPRRQQLLVEARDAAVLEGQLERAAGILERLIADYPDEEEAYMLLATVQGGLNRRDAQLATIRRGVEALPESGPLRNSYGYALAQRGRYGEAVREFETYARLEPDEPNPFDSLGEIYLVAGQPDQARQAYDRALQIEPGFFSAYGGRSLADAMQGRFDAAFSEGRKLQEIISRQGYPTTRVHFMFAFMHSRVGRLRQAQQELRAGLASTERFEQTDYRVFLELLSAVLALERQDDAGAADAVDRARAFLPNVSQRVTQTHITLLAHLLRGVVAARSGETNRAWAELEAQRDLSDDRSDLHRWFVGALEAEIAFATNDVAAAEDALAAGLPEGKMFFSTAGLELSVLANNLPCRDLIARVREARGDLEGAAEVYGQLNTPGIENPWTAIFEPRFVLEAARLLATAGDHEAAAAEYGRFLRLWEDADPDLPELGEARRYIAGQ